MENIFLDQDAIFELINKTSDSHFYSLKENYDRQNRYSVGRWDLGNYQNETAVFSIKDLVINEDFNSGSHLSNLITIDVILTGGVDTQFDHINLKNNDMPRILFSSHADNHQVRHHFAGGAYKALGLWLKPEMLIKTFGLSLNTFPQLTAELLAGKYNRTIALPITLAVKHCTDEIFSCQVNSVLDTKYLDAKITELFYHLIMTLHSPENAFNLNNQLSARQSFAMKKVLEALNTSHENSPCIDTIAKNVNMSVSGLSKTFKKSYGMNISKYRQQQKLMRSFDMILAGKFSILQIALDVGYRDQSSFTRAFKEYFGFTPTDLKHQ